MLVLGIESSCDESAVALLKIESGKQPEILFEEISSQINLHALYGGVVPELAAREHLANLPILVSRAMQSANVANLNIDLVAVTQGPGLKGCLLIGLEFAKGFCLANGIPLVGVNHIEGHVHAARLDNPGLEYPFLALVVSGGHTEIIKVENIGSYKLLARTIDDAAGEAFDKSANLLGFEYPGGARLAELADTVGRSDFKLPKVMRESEGFSFSGLKTAISLLIKRNADSLSDHKSKASLSFAIQEAIVDALLFKLSRELNNHSVKAITITGGVACNQRLRDKIRTITKLPIMLPAPKHCVDNAAMIALVAGLKLLANPKLKSDSLFPNEVMPRWPIETI